MVSDKGERRRRDVLLHVCLIELDPDPDMSIVIVFVVVRGEGKAGKPREEAEKEDLEKVSERVDEEERSSPGRLYSHPQRLALLVLHVGERESVCMKEYHWSDGETRSRVESKRIGRRRMRHFTVEVEAEAFATMCVFIGYSYNDLASSRRGRTDRGLSTSVRITLLFRYWLLSLMQLGLLRSELVLFTGLRVETVKA